MRGYGGGVLPTPAPNPQKIEVPHSLPTEAGHTCEHNATPR